MGGISKCGDAMVREMLFEAALARKEPVRGLSAVNRGPPAEADIRDGREQLLPSKGRIQMSKTNYLQTVISDLQRTAGPYRW